MCKSKSAHISFWKHTNLLHWGRKSKVLILCYFDGHGMSHKSESYNYLAISLKYIKIGSYMHFMEKNSLDTFFCSYLLISVLITLSFLVLNFWRTRNITNTYKLRSLIKKKYDYIPVLLVIFLYFKAFGMKVTTKTWYVMKEMGKKIIIKNVIYRRHAWRCQIFGDFGAFPIIPLETCNVYVWCCVFYL